MKIPKAHPVRKIVREVLAIAFWLHAIYAFKLLHIELPAIISTSRYFYNWALVGFILYYSYFSDRGWLSVIYDLGYIYFWPFILVFRGIWLSTKAGYKFVKSQTVTRSINLLVRDAGKPEPVVGDLPSIEGAESSDHTESGGIYRKIWRPLSRFCILWSALILTVDNKILICIACGIALLGAGKAIFNLWDFLSDTSSWIDKFKGNFAEQMAKRIALVREWEEGSAAESVTAHVNGLKVWESVFAFISDNKDFLAKCTIAVAALITIPFYCYVSVLFSLVYFGISKVQAISWTWSSALSTSLYMPFAFTDLPHSFAIRLIGGLQGIAVTIMGWNIISRNMNSRFERIASMAAELKGSFEDFTYRTKIQQISEAAAIKPPIAPKAKQRNSATIRGAKKAPRGSIRKAPKVS